MQAYLLECYKRITERIKGNVQSKKVESGIVEKLSGKEIVSEMDKS